MTVTLPLPPATTPCSLLSGIKVLDLTTSIAAPYATMLLGELGAEVVKIERPHVGDDSRAWGPPFLNDESLMYLSVNRNKSSVTLDYSTDAGYAVLARLVATADVVVTNIVHRVQLKLRIDAKSLKGLNDRLIIVSLTGFGLDGERKDMPCYDLIAEGFSGIMDMTGEQAGPPQKVGTPAADLLAGMDAVIGALACLNERTRSGKGHLVEISLTESMTRYLTPTLVSYLGSGVLQRRSGGGASTIAIYQPFETADEPITLGLGNDGIWKRFWKVIGDPAFGDDPRFSDNAGRRAHRDSIVETIQSHLKTRPRKEWLQIFASTNIPAGPINRIDEVTSDQMLLARGLFYQMKSHNGFVPQVGLGIRFDGVPTSPHSAPPALGEQTDLILKKWADLSSSDIEILRSDGTI